MAASKDLHRFQKLASITIVAVYLLFLIGASVRASGAGMGCPDWPTCFGQWIPPVSEAELPANYQSLYLGYENTRFNVVKTWTEYLNRLSGVIVGLLILLTALSSIRLRQSHAAVFYSSIAALVMVCIQGWLGSQVVASQLLPGLVTLHMLMALAIVCTLIFSLFRTRSQQLSNRLSSHQNKIIGRFLLLLGLFIIIQVSLGTQVREMIDFASQQAISRSQWVQLLPDFFYVHRSFSSIILITHLALLWYVHRQLGLIHSLTRIQGGLVITCLLTIATGAILNHIHFSALIQPFHLLLASLVFGLQFSMILEYFNVRQINANQTATL